MLHKSGFHTEAKFSVRGPYGEDILNRLNRSIVQIQTVGLGNTGLAGDETTGSQGNGCQRFQNIRNISQNYLTVRTVVVALRPPHTTVYD